MNKPLKDQNIKMLFLERLYNICSNCKLIIPLSNSFSTIFIKQKGLANNSIYYYCSSY